MVSSSRNSAVGRLTRAVTGTGYAGGNFVNKPPNQQDFLVAAQVARQHMAKPVSSPHAYGSSTENAPDPRVPLQWQGSTGFRVAHYIAATWVLAGLAASLGVYIIAAY